MDSSDDLRSRVQEAKADAAAIRRAVDALEGRVAEVESLLKEGVPAVRPVEEVLEFPVPEPVAAQGPAERRPPVAEVVRRMASAFPAEATEPEAGRYEPVAAPPTAPKPGLSRMAELVEENLGTKWFNWVGILAIVFAAAYFLKYTFEQGWITPAMRFYGGLAAGVVLLGCGHFAQRRSYPILARGFWGGGVAMLFLVFFAGFKLLTDAAHGGPIIGREIAFLGMVGTTAVGAALSIVHRSRAVAILSALGGYLTPILLSTGEVDQLFLFAYLAILTAGFLVIGHWMRWRFVPGMCWTTMVAYFAGWWLSNYPGSPALTVAFLCLFFLLFTAETVLGSAVLRLDTGRLTVLRAAATALLFAAAMLAILDEYYPAWMGCFALSAAGAHFAAAFVIARRQPAARSLAFLYGHAAAILLLLAPAVEERITTWGITVAWLGTGLVLLAGGRLTACGRARFWGLLALALALVRLVAIDTAHLVPADRMGSILFSRAGLLYAIAACVLWGAYGAMRLRPVRPRLSRPLGEALETASPWARAERIADRILLVTAAALPMALLWLGVDDVLRVYIAPRLGPSTLAYEHNRGLGFTFVFAAYAALMATAARRRCEPIVLWFAVCVLGATVIKMAVADLGLAYLTVETPLLNTRCATMAFAAACAFWLSREAGRDEPGALSLRPAGTSFLVAGHLLAVAALAMEWVDFAELHAAQGPGSPAFGASALGVAALLAIYGVIVQAVTAGTANRRALVRFGLLLLGAGAALWAFRCLVLSVPVPYPIVHFRFLSGAAIAGALFVSGRLWLGRRNGAEAPEARRFPGAVSILAANGLLLVMLTLEASDFFAARVGSLDLPRWLDPVYARGLSFSVIWTLYAIGMVVAGFIRAFRPVRVMALIILLGTTFKVFVFDLAFLTGMYRVLSFLTLGLILVGVAYAYQRHRQVLIGAEDSASDA
jgi:hypothetical protein